MVKRKVANPLAFAVLGSLGERSMHPYEISTMLRTRGKDGSIKLNYGSLYSVVAALEKHGFIEAVETVRDGNRPERTVYAITESGFYWSSTTGWPSCSARRRRSSASWRPGSPTCRLFPPDRVVGLLEQRAEALDTEIAQIEGMHTFMQSKGFPRIFWVESELRLALLKTQVDYVRELAREISADELEGSAFWRKTHQLVEQLGIEPADVLKDPVKYFGEEFTWMDELPPEAK